MCRPQAKIPSVGLEAMLSRFQLIKNLRLCVECFVLHCLMKCIYICFFTECDCESGHCDMHTGECLSEAVTVNLCNSEWRET